MRLSLCKIMNVVYDHDSYLVQCRDVCGLGLSMIQKSTIGLRMLVYNVAVDAIDKYCCLVETIAIECLKHFVKTIRANFECEYLW